jgi:GGDEF domain-containing protein
VLAWEIDGLGALETRLGPQGTRQALAAVARAARGVLQDDDVLGALEPGRFAVACRETDAIGAAARAGRLRDAVGAVTLDAGGPHAPLEARVGIAACRADAATTDEAADAVLRDAIAALGRR